MLGRLQSAGAALAAAAPASRCSVTSQGRRLNHSGAIANLIFSYRQNGHLRAQLDPLGRWIAGGRLGRDKDGFSLSVHGLSGSEAVGSLHPRAKTTKELAQVLEAAYCGTLSVQSQHLSSAAERQFFIDHLEVAAAKPVSKEEQLHVLASITATEVVDHYLAKKFPTTKRYGCEGTEMMVPAVERIISLASKHKLDDVVIGMPHRGRLNLLVNTLGYPAEQLFHKIRGHNELGPASAGTGDVLSHLCASADIGKVHVSMLPNPSHLEAVDPVALGKTRSKLDHGRDALCLMLHGDAAFAGQGVVAECFQMMNLPHFTVNGALHIIVNNQLGFTTDTIHARSTFHSSDLAKFAEVPIVHVNAEDPDAVLRACHLAFDFRQQFHKDVVIDLFGYRRHGHNELDEPAFTQPLLYSAIRNRESLVTIYGKKLGAMDLVEKVRAETGSKLDEAFKKTTDEILAALQFDHRQGQWSTTSEPAYPAGPVATGYDRQKLIKIGLASNTLPADFKPHDRLIRARLQQREKALEQNKVDWATAEALAFGSLAEEGFRVRMSGQDVSRGTFSHRHLHFVDSETGHVHPVFDPKKVQLCNSLLSEESVLSFEWGYASENPDSLVIWEAQFGDFHNPAQVPIDTYLASAIPKWRRQASLVLALPHGFDGTGPEHSSCRLERFLLFSSPTNPTECHMSVVNPTTPAQYFHALRRQMHHTSRIPCVIVGPKTLLRDPHAVSKMEDMASGTHFQQVIDDEIAAADPHAVRSVVFCSGKYYYDIAKHLRGTLGLKAEVAIVRLEELVPFPAEELAAVLRKYTFADPQTNYIWCQEEPENAGAWRHASVFMRALMDVPNLRFVGRQGVAAVATGSTKDHEKEGKKLLTDLQEALHLVGM